MNISNKILKKQKKIIIINGILTAATDSITSGTILMCFASSLGASSIFLGILAAIPYFANLTNLFSGYIIKIFGSCKKTIIICSLISKPMLLFLVILPFLNNHRLSLKLLFLLLCFVYLSGNIIGGTYNIWLKKIIPDSMIGALLGQRLKYMMIVQVCCYIITYLIIQKTHINSPDKFCPLFIMAFVLGILSIITFFKLIEKSEQTNVNVPTFKTIFQDVKKNGLIIIKNLGFLFLLSNIMLSGITIFLLKGLLLKPSVVIALTACYQLSSIISIQHYSFLIDNHINCMLKKFLLLFLYCSILFFIFNCFTFSNEILMFVILVLLEIFFGIINGVLTIILNTLTLKLVPLRQIYTLLPVIKTTNSLFIAIGNIASGFLITIIIYNKKFFHITYDHQSWMIFFIFISIFAFFEYKKLKNNDII